MSRLTDLQMRFVNLRFGTFIHFNSGTAQFYKGDVGDWEYGVENCGEKRRFPFDEKDWAPEDIDCAGWAKVAKSAGCRFAALTAKHHEGFANWPTAYSEHCVKNAANKTDIVGKYLDAFRAEGIEAGLYYSVLDLTAGCRRNSFTEEHRKMVFGQIGELLTNYGEIPFLIIDGWSAPWGGPSYDLLPFEEVDAFVKSLQPECLLMNIGCTEGIGGTDIVFYENGAGQTVGENFRGPGALCQKLTKTWMWRETDPADTLQSADWAIGQAQKCFASNTAFMLNISPDKDGRVDANQAAAFAEIGKKLILPPPLTELPDGWLLRENV